MPFNIGDSPQKFCTIVDGDNNRTIRLSGHAGSLSDQDDSCISDWGIEDMIGNVNEFVSDWMPGNKRIGSTETHGATHGIDRAKVVTIRDNAEGGSQFPAVVIRGSSTGADGQGIFSIDAYRQPTITQNVIGFRCALPL
jgi:formylglycine-generating enzyme required for sulfatase activity